MANDSADSNWSQAFADIVGKEHIRSADESDSVDGLHSEVVVEPGTPSEVARVLAMSTAAGKSVVPQGGGTKLDWGTPPRRADVLLSMKRLNRVLEHAAGDMTVTVEAGVTIEELQTVVAKQNQRLALDPLWPHRATIGGVLATADAGPLRWTFGTPRDLVLGVTVALADGTLARSGGKVVKNVAGYDLPKLFCGSFGTLGVITQATFRLHPVPEAARTLHFSLPLVDDIARFVAAMQECALHVAAVQICKSDDSTTADVLLEGPLPAVEAKLRRVNEAAVASGAVALTGQAPIDRWLARQRLFEETGSPCVVARFGLQPAKLVFLPDILATARERNIRGTCVAQAGGSGLLRLEADEPSELVPIVPVVRDAVESFGGSIVVLRAPIECKQQIDVWGDIGDAFPLMQRIKHQFDPTATLNPGRFVGGI